MSKITTILLVISFMFATPVIAGKSASFTLSFNVPPIKELSVNSETIHLTIDPITDMITATTTYDIMTNMQNMKIVAQLAEDVPKGVTFTVQIEAPTNWTSLGKKPLNATNTTILATGVNGTSEKDLVITYEILISDTMNNIPNISSTIYFSLIE